MITIWLQELIDLNKAGELDNLKLWDSLGADQIDHRRAFGERIAADLDESTKFTGVTVEQTAVRLLNLASFSLGRHCQMIDGTHRTRPGLYSIIIAPSGSTKSPVSSWMHENTIDEWSNQFARFHMQRMDHVSEARVREPGPDGTDRERLMTSAERKWVLEKLHLDQISPVAGNVTLPALQLALKNSSCFLFYDEAKVFFKQFCPGRIGDQNDNLDFLTEIYTKSDFKFLRVKEGARDVFDANLALLLTGTPASFDKFLSREFIEGGGLWRYDCYVQDLDDDAPDHDLSMEFLSRPRPKPRPPVAIEAMLKRLFRENFILDFPMEMQAGFEEAGIVEFGYRPTPPRTREHKQKYCYSLAAQANKDKLCNFFLDFTQSKFLKKRYGSMASMVAKLPERLDKYAMILQAIRNAEGVEEVKYCLSTGAIEVSEATLDCALDFARLMITGWSRMHSLSEQRSEEETRHLQKKKRKFPSALRHFVSMFEVADTTRAISLDRVVEELPARLAGYQGVSASSKRNLKMQILEALGGDGDHVKFLDPDKKTFVLDVDLG